MQTYACTVIRYCEGWQRNTGVESERKCDISGDVRKRRMHSLLAADASIDRSHTRTSTYTPWRGVSAGRGQRGNDSSPIIRSIGSPFPFSFASHSSHVKASPAIHLQTMLQDSRDNPRYPLMHFRPLFSLTKPGVFALHGLSPLSLHLCFIPGFIQQIR